MSEREDLVHWAQAHAASHDGGSHVQGICRPVPGSTRPDGLRLLAGLPASCSPDKARHGFPTDLDDLDPLETVEKLAALVPPPRFNLVRYHGVLAPAAHSRSQIVPANAMAEADSPPREFSCEAARRSDQLVRE